MAEEGEAQEVPADSAEATDPAQQTNEAQNEESPTVEGADSAPVEETGTTEQPVAEDAAEGPPDPGEQGTSVESPTEIPPEAAEDPQPAEVAEEGAVQPADTEPEKMDEGADAAQTELDPGGDGAAPDVAPGEGEAGEVTAEGPPPDTPASGSDQHEAVDDASAAEETLVAEDEAPSEGEEEDDAGVTDTTSQQGEEDDEESVAEQTTEGGSAEDTTVPSADGESTTDRSSGEQGSAKETSTPGSGVSGDGRSLTRLVERSSLEQQHRALLLLRRQLLARNQRLQQRLSQHFSRKTDDGAERVEKNLGELEARYTRYLSGIREQQRFTAEERERRHQELSAFRAQVEHQTEMVAAAYSTAVELRRQVALKSRSSRTGRLMAAAEVETLIGREQQKELEVQEARLESLRRETRLNRLEQTLRESEELAGGIHLIDFEQLKIENQTYAEKIEERNEDLTKLRRKISSTVQILTHLKERIQFEQTENTRRQDHLQTVSAEVTHGRESLAQLKQRRDQVRSRTASQRATAGLLGHEALLRDFEARVDEEGRLVRELQTLKREYADNQRMTQVIRQTVRAKKQQQHDRRTAASRH